MRQIEFTWWAADGSERRGRVSLASNAAPETEAALARMMRLSDRNELGMTGTAQAPFWLEGAGDTFDGPQEEHC